MASKLADAYVALRMQMDEFVNDIATGKKLLIDFVNSASQTLQSGFMRGFSLVSEGAEALFSTIASTLRSAFDLSGLDIGIGNLIGNAMEKARGELKLGAMVQISGGVAGFSTDDLKTMSKELSNVTTYSDREIQKSMALLLSYQNVRGEVFERAIKAALDLSTVTEGGLTPAIQRFGKALDDPIQGVNALRRGQINLSLAQSQAIKKLAKSGDVVGAQELMLSLVEKRSKGIAQAMAQGFSGMVDQMRNTMQDLGASMGSFFFPILRPLVIMMRQVGSALQENEEVWRNWGERIGNTIDYVIKSLKPAFDKIFNTIGPIIKRIGDMTVSAFERLGGVIAINPGVVASVVLLLTNIAAGTAILVAFRVALFGISIVVSSLASPLTMLSLGMSVMLGSLVPLGSSLMFVRTGLFGLATILLMLPNPLRLLSGGLWSVVGALVVIKYALQSVLPILMGLKIFMVAVSSVILPGILSLHMGFILLSVSIGRLVPLFYGLLGIFTRAFGFLSGIAALLMGPLFLGLAGLPGLFAYITAALLVMTSPLAGLKAIWNGMLGIITRLVAGLASLRIAFMALPFTAVFASLTRLSVLWKIGLSGLAIGFGGLPGLFAYFATILTISIGPMSMFRGLLFGILIVVTNLLRPVGMLFSALGGASGIIAGLAIALRTIINPLGLVRILIFGMTAGVIPLVSVLTRFVNPMAMIAFLVRGLALALTPVLSLLGGLGFILGPVAIGIAVLIALAAAFAISLREIADNEDDMAELLGIFDDIKEVMLEVWQAIKALGVELYAVLSQSLGGDAFTKIKEAIVDALRSAISGIREFTAWVVANKEILADWVHMFGRIAFGVGLVIAAVMVLKVAIAALTAVFSVLSVLMSPPFIAVAAVIGIVIGLMYAYGVTTTDVFESIESLVMDFQTNMLLAWKAIQAGFWRMFANIMGGLSALGRGTWAFLSGDWGNIGKESGIEFDKEFKKWSTPELNKEISELKEKRQSGIDKRRQEREDARKKAEDEEKERKENELKEKKKKQKPEDPEAPNQQKAALVGLTDMWEKTVQASAGGSMIDMTKGINENTKKTATGVMSLKGILEAIKGNTAEPKPGTVAAG